MKENRLIDELVSSTGLPQDPVEKELATLVKAAGLTPQALNLEELRQVMTKYLQEVLLEAKDTYK